MYFQMDMSCYTGYVHHLDQVGFARYSTENEWEINFDELCLFDIDFLDVFERQCYPNKKSCSLNQPFNIYELLTNTCSEEYQSKFSEDPD